MPTASQAPGSTPAGAAPAARPRRRGRLGVHIAIWLVIAALLYLAWHPEIEPRKGLTPGRPGLVVR